MTNPRICYIGPLSIHMYRWIKAFFERGYEVFLIADSRLWMPQRIGFAPVHFLPTVTGKGFLRFLLPNILATINLLMQIKPELVHLHVQHYLMPAILLSRLPYLLTSWGVEVLNLPQANLLFKASAKMTGRKAKMITVDAECLREIWIRNGILRSKIRVIPFGVDTSIFNPNVDGTEVRNTLHIEDNDIAIISTRPFYNDHYDVERLIRAAPLVLKRHANAKFIIKGSGPLEAYLRKLATRLDVSESVRFAGIVPYNQIAHFLSASDIYVSTCFVDSTSVSLLEAMACGLAPIVTDIQGNREWVQDGVNGFLFPPRSHTRLAEKINQLIEDEWMRKKFGKCCVEIVDKKATWRKCVAEMEAIYESLL